MQPNLSPFFDTFLTMAVLMVILFIIFAVIGLRARGSMTGRMISMVQQMQEVMMQVPDHALPPEMRGQTSGSDVRTVRLPTNCPSCKAAVSHEGIDWVGPLEVKCAYCGGTLRASFERI